MTALFCPYAEALAAGQFVDAIISKITDEDHVALPELLAFLDPHVPTKGDYALVLKGTNLVMWNNLSQEVIDLVQSAIASGKVAICTPTHDFIYVGSIGLPYGIKRGYQQPRHFGVVLRPTARAKANHVIRLDCVTVWS
jgi:hypothetical protein